MTRTTPIVEGGTLSFQDEGQWRQLAVGSSEWFLWLEGATSFTFRGSEGSFTARRERSSSQRGGWYWKGYARRNGKLCHTYLGKAELLSYDRLCQAVISLGQRFDASPAVSAMSILQRQATQVPVPATPLIGREQQIRTACALLRRSDVRLLTMTGPGGIGKTRLALHVATLLQHDFPAGVCFLALEALTDTSQLLPTLAQALVGPGDDAPLARLTTLLRDLRVLLLLDTFEHLITAAPQVGELLHHCPGITLLITSREQLHLRLEHELVVPSLSLPDVMRLPDSARLAQYESIALFVQRATAAKEDFQLTEGNAHAVAQLCTRLDGLPLALELAAARIKLLPPQALLAYLERPLQVLTGGARDLPARQQTLRASLAWSYDLLEPALQRLFCQLAVFIGGCTFEAVEWCYQRSEQAAEITVLLEQIALLIDKSVLQQRSSDDGEARLFMLGMVREYGLERLEASEQGSAIRAIHAWYYLSFAEQAGSHVRGERQVEWFNHLEQEADNIRAALEWFCTHGEVEEAMRLCASLWLFWIVRDHRSEGAQWTERVLALEHDAALAPRIWANALYAAGILTDSQGLYTRAEMLWQQALALYQRCGDRPGIAAALNKIGHIHARSAAAEAHTYFERSLAVGRACQNIYAIADALTSLAEEASSLNDTSRARALLEECLALYQEVKDTRSCAYCLGNLGLVAANEGNHAAAREFYTRSLALHRSVGDRVGIAFGLIPLGLVTLYSGDYSTAHVLLEESLTVSKELGNHNEIVRYLELLSEVALFQKSERTQAGEPLLEESLAILQESGNEEGIASKLFSLGYIELSQGNFTSAHKLLEACEIIFRTRKNSAMTAMTLYLLGHVKSYLCDYAAARVLMEECVAMARQRDDRLVLASRLCYLGLVQLNEGRPLAARACLEESLACARESGNQWSIADALGVMALVLMQERAYATAQAMLEESLAILQAHEDRYATMYRLADLGTLAMLQGDLARARPLVERALTMAMQAGNRWFIASCLERLGILAVKYPVHAARLWGCADHIRTTIGAPLPPIERAPYERAVERARLHLGTHTFQSAWELGSTLTPEQVLALPLPQASDQTPLPASPLTLREREVLRLLASGLTNGEIAQRLVISPRTVQTHLSAIYSKINVTTRSAATRYAIEQRFV